MLIQIGIAIIKAWQQLFDIEQSVIIIWDYLLSSLYCVSNTVSST